MNIINKTVMVVNENSWYYHRIGTVLKKDKDKYRYLIHLNNGEVIILHKNNMVLLDNDNKPLVNGFNSYCYWCNNQLKRHYLCSKNFFTYINYCPNCLR